MRIVLAQDTDRGGAYCPRVLLETVTEQKALIEKLKFDKRMLSTFVGDQENLIARLNQTLLQERISITRSFSCLN